MSHFQPKIINDPVYGFISINHQIIFELIEHPYFQRLRNIKQLGLSYLVYPGAHHTRFHHALGAMHLLTEALQVLKSKGVMITDEEAEAATIAILLHDIGHGPFSHALENHLIKNVNHEDLSLQIMQQINDEWSGKLDLAISIFTNNYHKHFLHQLVSSQLDMDRLDYLTRDSFFTGVAEGVISYDRIIKMLTVVDDELMVEEKGVNSIEKFLISRRLMYWQVYLHKTVIAAEELLIKIIQRATELVKAGQDFFLTQSLKYLFLNQLNPSDLHQSKESVLHYLQLDDAEIFTNIKYWQHSGDECLSELSRQLITRNLPKVEIENEAIKPETVALLKEKFEASFEIKNATDYFVFTGSISNYAYRFDKGQIKIKMKNGDVVDVLQLLNHLNVEVFTEPDIKYYICYPKSLAT